MKLYLTEGGVEKVYHYPKEIHPDIVLEDVRSHASMVSKVIRDFNIIYPNGSMRFHRPLYCTAIIS